MILTPLPPLSLRDLAAANLDSLNRSPGLHVTQVIYQGIMPSVDPARWGPQAKQDFADETSENWQEAGFMWEEMLSAVFARRAVAVGETSDGAIRCRPGELTKDGVILSPDAVVYGLADFPDTRAEVVEEYKATWKSSKNFDLYDKRYLGWLMQIRCYCIAVGTTEARLYVFHVNGGYQGYLPEVKPYRLTFTPAELTDQWHQILNTARKKGWLA